MSIFVTSKMMPGAAVGTQELLTIPPALPNDAPDAGPVLSTKVTEKPLRARLSAIDVPIIPAPTTMVVLFTIDLTA